ncbi:hypothetical protein AUEXF2481DRAFT_8813 [Aureobasidium subglaciale EXF-2481]|uniref:Uncharacterized protein n=1 Tax=Aureobasidium subglaciale (strain EXF-2481) TaxID=1043005 RepID=A0A074Y5I2_AURSE|nr:uncharacterized protein AUEXF2481DRAFT_8813 [Aureobasidium subglaciale EXF-2481]KEQ91199.1 hypothetical protein AUEXF2481DRAFT_8813 [Aureobasidium subglaciale EXF-2481]
MSVLLARACQSTNSSPLYTQCWSHLSSSQILARLFHSSQPHHLSREESRARKNAKRREKYANDKEFREKTLQYKREKYANDPEYRKKVHAWVAKLRAKLSAEDPDRKKRPAPSREKLDEVNAKHRERWANDEEYREAKLASIVQYRAKKAADKPERRPPPTKDEKAAKARERYADDPEYRARKLASATRWYEVKGRAKMPKTRRERYANDPEYRAKALASAAHWYEVEGRARKQEAYDQRVQEQLVAREQEAHKHIRHVNWYLQSETDSQERTEDVQVPGYHPRTSDEQDIESEQHLAENLAFTDISPPPPPPSPKQIRNLHEWVTLKDWHYALLAIKSWYGHCGGIVSKLSSLVPGLLTAMNVFVTRIG